MANKKNKSTKRNSRKPSRATIARREARIAALARAITILIFSTYGGVA